MHQLTKEDIYFLLNKQFELNWYNAKIEEVWRINLWQNIYTTNEEMENKFREILFSFLKEKKFPKKLAEKAVGHLLLQYWLRVRNECEEKERLKNPLLMDTSSTVD